MSTPQRAASGFITYDELQDVVRHKLSKGPSALSDGRIQQLWCSLDADDSNQVVPEEFGKFLKRGAREHKAKPSLDRQKTELGSSADLAKGRALECTPTAELRGKLEAPLSDEELTELSKQLSAWLSASLQAQNKSIHSWYNLFNDADLDGDGVITLDELEQVVRQRLKKGKGVMPDDKLHALWCALDVDNSNSIMPEEFGAFLRRGRAELKSKGPSNLNKKTIELGGSQTDGLGRALESTPTAEMRASLEAELTDDELTELSRKMCRWLEESLHKQNLSVHSWFNLFNEADEDGSGFITCTAECRVEPARASPPDAAAPRADVAGIGTITPRPSACSADRRSRAPSARPFSLRVPPQTTSSRTCCAGASRRDCRLSATKR